LDIMGIIWSEVAVFMSENSVGSFELSGQITGMASHGIVVSDFPMREILSMDIHVAPNEHATAAIRGAIDDGLMDAFRSAARSDKVVSVTHTDEDGKSVTLFVGSIDGVWFPNENGRRVLDLKLVSGSKLMDATAHTRTYQDAAMTYGDILASFGYYSGYSFSMRVGEDAAIGSLVAQYKETDWEFVKRLASHFNAIVVPDYVSEGVGYFFGLPEKSSGSGVDSSRYSEGKDIGEFVGKSMNDVAGMAEGDAISFDVSSKTLRRMGERVHFGGRDYRVAEIRSVLEERVIENYYTLKNEAGLKVKRSYNPKLVGASLASTATSVRKDEVQLRVHEDCDDFGTGTRWFPYSTVYSTPDGTGWYAMPEAGDELRLCFPSEREAEAYAISAVNVDTPGMGENRPATAGQPSAPPPRTDPDVKTVINKEFKEVSLYPDKIVMTNNNGMTVIIDDAEGIIIQSDKKVEIRSGGGINVVSSDEGLSMMGGDNVNITVGGTAVDMADDVRFDGGSLYMQ
jgi:hypothetical protein